MENRRQNDYSPPEGGLDSFDPQISALAAEQKHARSETLGLIASASPTHPAVVAAEGGPFAAVTAEGYPGKRFHSGAQTVDKLENLAIERAKAAFSAAHANVQPLSGSSANLAVMFSLLKPGDTILSMSLDAGGHLTHGSKASVTSRYFRVVHYGVDEEGWLDYNALARLAEEHRPRLIICGASSYPREIQFDRIRQIADSIGALLLADISHISGLVAAGIHQSPIEFADVTTTSTYKQLRGPRGGLILLGQRGYESPPIGGKPLIERIDRSVFPQFQGTPSFSSMAAKAVAFRYINSPDGHEWINNIHRIGAIIAEEMRGLGYSLMTGGTDTHMIVVDFRTSPSLDGARAEQTLEQAGVLVNRNTVPNDPRPANKTSGIRIGANELALHNPSNEAVGLLVKVIDQLLAASGTAAEADARTQVARCVHSIKRHYPLTGF